jgi:aminopeptidase N
MSNTAPRFLADYRPADFTISTVYLTIFLNDSCSQVVSELSVIRQGGSTQSLVLNGEKLRLTELSIEGESIPEECYTISEDLLTISHDALPTKKQFNLIITTEINPLTNTALEGLFKSGDAFCTQCEAEGFRRISYYLDRPDVMATFTTKVIADKSLYPYLLSNGNKIDEGDLDHNRHFVTWHDPFPKPCYLFALVAGDFDLLEDFFHNGIRQKSGLRNFC